MLKMAENWKRVSLPPVEQPPTVDDPYAKSKLMTYTRSRERQKRLNLLMSVSLLIVCKVYSVMSSCIKYNVSVC